MKKIIAVVIAAVLILSTCAWGYTPPKMNMERCPFCGEENVFVWHGEPGNSFGQCTKCGQNTLRYQFRVNINTYGNDEDMVEAYLIQNGDVYRLNQAYGNHTFVEFDSVQYGWYQLVIVKNNVTVYNQMVFVWCNMAINVFQKPMHYRWW